MRALLPNLVAYGSLAVLAALVLWVAGRPLSTNDLWWHLRMGEAYAEQGPWLDADPSLHTAREPPEPVAWLFALGTHGFERGLGFAGLRGLHTLMAAAIIALAFSIFRLESAGPTSACLATGVFLVLAWSRLMQLRPDLVSILATLALYRLVLEPREPPGWRRVAAAVLLMVVWANAHALFMLGPCLLAAALAGCVLRRALLSAFPAARGEPSLQRDGGHAIRIAATLGLGLLAALANPRGIHQHLTFATSAGQGAIQAVRDDWTPFHPLHGDRYGLGVGPLERLSADVVVLLVAICAGIGTVRFLRRPAPETLRPVDPVLLGLAAAALVAAAVAVRFLWLVVLPLLFLLRFHAAVVARRPAAEAPLAWILAAASVFLAAALPVSSAYSGAAAPLPRTLSAYLTTHYSAGKFHEEGVRFLEETGIEGNLYNFYGRGGFLGYRLAPRLRTFIDGSMNVDNDVLVDYWSIGDQRGSLPGENFLDVLERRRVDVFFGVGTPLRGPGGDHRYTATHLERAAGWLLVARGPDYAIYLRANARNAANLGRVAAWYAREGIPFDRAWGLDVSQIVVHHSDWAVARGMLPARTAQLLARRESADPAIRFRALNVLARAYLLIGAYPEQVAADREAAALRPGAIAPRRRLVVGLLRLDRPEAALDAARELQRAAPRDPSTRALVEAAERYARMSLDLTRVPLSAQSGPPLDALINRLPVFAPIPASAGD